MPEGEAVQQKGSLTKRPRVRCCGKTLARVDRFLSEACPAKASCEYGTPVIVATHLKRKELGHEELGSEANCPRDAGHHPRVAGRVHGPRGRRCRRDQDLDRTSRCDRARQDWPCVRAQDRPQAQRDFRIRPRLRTPDQCRRAVRRVFVSTTPTMEALFKEGKLVADTRTNIVRSGTGVEVRAGASKPDVGSVEAFKRALLDAKSIELFQGRAGYRSSSSGSALPIASPIESQDRRILIRSPSLVAKGELEHRRGRHHSDPDDTRRRDGRTAPPEIQFYGT